MAHERNPDDPHPAPRSDDDIRREEESIRRITMTDNEFQVDPELIEGRASSTRIGVFALAILAILGVVLYGLNTASNTPTTTATHTQNPPAKTTGQAPASNASSGAVTPQRSGAQPGTTTGSAPQAPAPPAPGEANK
jgi:hypothetical protein